MTRCPSPRTAHLPRAVSLFALLLAGASPGAADELVRQLTRTDEAVQTFGVTGEGVLVAILDRGIDWDHPDFVRPDGTTRIRAILDLSLIHI